METLNGQCTDMTNTNKKKVVFHGMKGEQIEVDLKKHFQKRMWKYSEHDAVKHHNKTVNVESGAWNKRNFSNDPTKVYDGFEIKQDHGEPLFPWLHDIFKKRKKK